MTGVDGIVPQSAGRASASRLLLDVGSGWLSCRITLERKAPAARKRELSTNVSPYRNWRAQLVPADDGSIVSFR